MFTSHLGKAIAVFLLISFLLSTSCTSFQLINSDKDALQNELKKGDVVRITTKERGTFTLKILEIKSDTIVGKGRVKKDIPDKYPTKQQILFNEITEIKRMQFSSGTTNAILSLIGLLLVLVAIGGLYAARTIN